MIQKTIYKTKDYAKVKFTLEASNARSVELLGLNANWQKGIKMTKRKDGQFQAEVNLPKNTSHEFKYLIDKNEWLSDPAADQEVPNVFGSTNSLVTI